MANLDNLTEMQNLDRENILTNIKEFPEQCERCWADWEKLALPAGFIQAKNVVLCGVGGSGIGGSLVSSLADQAKVPVVVRKDYDLPGFVDKDTLVICTSYSGNTEETITSLKKAAEKTKKIITISTGGKVASLATNYRNPHYKIEYGSQPRAAIGYTFISILSIFVKLGFIELKADDFKEAILLLKGLQRKIDVHAPAGANSAKLLARKISTKIPVTYGAGILAHVAERWKGDFNENAKSAAYWEVIPELNHNSLVGLQFPKELRSKIFVIILQSKFGNDRNRLRETITGQILDRFRIDYEFLMLEPAPTPISEILQTIHYGDYVSYYLAMINNVEPNPVTIIKFLKDKLDEKPIE